MKRLHAFEIEEFEVQGHVFTVQGTVEQEDPDKDLMTMALDRVTDLGPADERDVTKTPLTEPERVVFLVRHRLALCEALRDLWEAQEAARERNAL